MRIGIDIDDVITDTSLAMKNYIEAYDNNGNISNYMEEVMRGEMPTPYIKKFFEDNIIEILKNAKLKENASKVIQRLLNNGNEIFIITARGEEKFKGSEDETLEYFKLNNINYTKILFNSFDKAKLCKDNKINLMVDDSIKHCLEVQKENIKSILFTSVVNKSRNIEIDRVNNWLELEEKINIGWR